VGKDLVRPAKSPSAYHYERSSGPFETFVYGRQEDGSPLESTCDPDELSSYFVDKSTPHFLTPVYFRAEVLGIYYAEPKRFHISANGVSCLDLWSMPHDINKEGLVQVWLGDLAKLPPGHQVHWKRHNVMPRGTITEHRFRRDFLAEFADPKDDPVYDFHRALETVIETATARSGGPLFLPLRSGDEYVPSTIRLPLTNDDSEFDQLVGALAKVTNDSLNVELIRAQSGLAIDGTTIKGSIGLLAAWLAQLGAAAEAIDAATGGLNAVQALRSTGAAHRKGENYEKTLARLGIDGIPNQLRFRSILTRVTGSLVLINEVLATPREADSSAAAADEVTDKPG
jgi:hypothetical protein